MYAPNWYWFIGSDNTQVFSSAHAALLPVYHPDYLSWTHIFQTTAPKILSYSELFDLLTQQAPNVANQIGVPWVQSGLLTTAQSLLAYINNGVQVISSGSPMLNGVYPLGTIAILGYNVAKAQLLNGSLTFPQFFPDINNVPHAFPTSGDFNLFFGNVINYFQGIQALGAGASGVWPSPIITF